MAIEVDIITPGDRVCTYAEVLAHLRASSDELTEAQAEQLIDAASDYAQQAMNRTLLTSTLAATFHIAPHTRPGRFILPRGPVASVVSVTANGDAITDYDLETVGNTDELIINESFSFPVVITYTAGEEAVSAMMKQSILCHIGTLYAQRESVSDRASVNIPHQLADFYRMRSRNVGMG